VAAQVAGVPQYLLDLSQQRSLLVRVPRGIFARPPPCCNLFTSSRTILT
jgi:hypothetical protein